MRVAVALPSLGPDAPHRSALDEVAFELMRTGLRVEAFAEADRLADGAEGLEVFHYLRLPERHAAQPFDVALYPLGRDLQAFDPVVISMRLLPGVVWVLDPVLHHLWVSGIAFHLRWGEYRDLMDRAFPGRGSALMHTLAASWASDAFYRAFDPSATVLAGQRGVIAVSAAIASSLPGDLGEGAEVVPLPLVRGGVAGDAVEEGRDGEGRDPPEDGHDGGNGSVGAGGPRMLIVTLNGNQPGPVLDGLGSLMAGSSPPEAAVCVGEPVYNANFAVPASRLGIRDRVRWILDPDDATVSREAEGADILAFLRRDPTAADRVRIDRALAAGKAVIVRRSDLYDDLPDGAVAKVDPGRALGPCLAAIVEALGADPTLADGLGAAGREFAAALPDACTVALRLRSALAAIGLPEERGDDPHGRGRAWRELGPGLRSRIEPPGGGSAAAAEIAAALRRVAPPSR